MCKGEILRWFEKFLKFPLKLYVVSVMAASEKTDNSEGRIQNALWFSSQTRRLVACYFVSRQKKCFEKGVIVVIGFLHSFHAYMIEQAGKIASEQ